MRYYLEIRKSCTNGCGVYEKKCVSENINQFHNEITFPPNKNGYSQNSKTRVLMKMCIK